MPNKKVLDMIKKKAKKFKEYRTNSSRSMTPEKIALRFIEDVDKAKCAAVDKYDFEADLEKAAMIMENRLRAFDPYVDIEVSWSKQDETWKDLRVTGIFIKWSDVWKQANPDKDQEQMIDIGHMLLEGIFDEDL